MTYKFKEGDRVLHEDGDFGTVVKYEGSIYSSIGNLWVLWDSSGKILNCVEENCRYIPADAVTEQEAVMLLLGLGYTVSKK